MKKHIVIFIGVIVSIMAAYYRNNNTFVAYTFQLLFVVFMVAAFGYGISGNLEVRRKDKSGLEE